MNTGPLRPAVATVFTVHGIETEIAEVNGELKALRLQQSLPFTVLKLDLFSPFMGFLDGCNSLYRSRY